MATDFSLDFGTPRGQVRLLIGDTDPLAYAYNDVRIDAFLTLEGNAVRRAAALALEVASADPQLYQQLKLGDLELDGPAAASHLLRLAANYRGQQAEATAGGGATTAADRPAMFTVASGRRGR